MTYFNTSLFPPAYGCCLWASSAIQLCAPTWEDPYSHTHLHINSSSSRHDPTKKGIGIYTLKYFPSYLLFMVDSFVVDIFRKNIKEKIYIIAFPPARSRNSKQYLQKKVRNFTRNLFAKNRIRYVEKKRRSAWTWTPGRFLYC